MKSNGITDVSAKLKTNQSLSCLHLSSNSLTIKNNFCVLNSFTSNIYLTFLEINSSFINDFGFEIITRELKAYKTIVYLSVCNNFITDISSKSIADLIQINTLKIFKISNNNLKDNFKKILFDNLVRDSNINVLEMKRCGFRSKNNAELWRVCLKMAENLHISLDHNLFLGNKNEELFDILLEKSTFLKFLSLSKCELGDI